MEFLLVFFSLFSTSTSLYSEQVLSPSGDSWLIDRIQVNFFKGPWEGAVEGVIFGPDTKSPFKSRREVMKRYLNFIRPSYSLRLGTIYTGIGRGFLFNATEEEVARLERFLDGVELNLKEKNIAFKTFFGRPKSFLYYNLEDSTDLVGAGDIFLGRHRSGVGIAFLGMSHPLERGRKKEQKLSYITGLRMTKSRGPWALYLEGALRWGWNSTFFKDTLGSALYLFLGSDIPFGSLRFETKDLRAFGHPYMLAPTLNHYGITLNNGVDERGVLFGTDFSVLPLTFLTLEYSHTWSSGTGSATKGGHLEEEFVELKRTGDPLTLFFSFDRIFFRKATSVGLPHRLEQTAALGMLLRFPKGLGAELRYQRRNRDTQGVRYTDNDWLLSISRFPEADVVFAYEKRVGDEKGLWRRVELIWHLDDFFDLNVTIGKQRADLVCSGGVCRIEPAFQGVKIKLLGRF